MEGPAAALALQGQQDGNWHLSGCPRGLQRGDAACPVGGLRQWHPCPPSQQGMKRCCIQCVPAGLAVNAIVHCAAPTAAAALPLPVPRPSRPRVPRPAGASSKHTAIKSTSSGPCPHQPQRHRPSATGLRRSAATSGGPGGLRCLACVLHRNHCAHDPPPPLCLPPCTWTCVPTPQQPC